MSSQPSFAFSTATPIIERISSAPMTEAPGERRRTSTTTASETVDATSPETPPRTFTSITAMRGAAAPMASEQTARKRGTPDG